MRQRKTRTLVSSNLLCIIATILASTNFIPTIFAADEQIENIVGGIHNRTQLNGEEDDGRSRQSVDGIASHVVKKEGVIRAEEHPSDSIETDDRSRKNDDRPKSVFTDENRSNNAKNDRFQQPEEIVERDRNNDRTEAVGRRETLRSQFNRKQAERQRVHQMIMQEMEQEESGGNVGGGGNGIATDQTADEGSSKPAQPSSWPSLSALMANPQEIVDRVNNDPKRKWTAEVDPIFSEMTAQDISRLAGTLLTERQRGNESSQRGAMPAMVDAYKLPKSFDAREKWPKCASLIGTIRDQSACGSCWAVAIGAMVTDRLCIKREELGNSSPQLDPTFMASETDILACSKLGDCNGGVVEETVEWVANNRIVSGGNYSSRSFCMPYPFPPHRCVGICESPVCTNSCTNISYYRSYPEDKVILGGGDRLEAGHFSGSGNIEKIKAEIFTRGPIVATMHVPYDFRFYKSGIYEPTTPIMIGGHAVRIIGWGEGPDAIGVIRRYWLVANSWNTNFGEDGFFRIILGRNAARIENLGLDYLVLGDDV